MRKALLPMLASLALCGAAAAAMAVSTANAQPETRNPVMVPVQLAQNDISPDGRGPRDLRRRDTGDIAARMKQMCQDQVARETGQLAYLQSRLQLTASQQSAFQSWSQAKLGIAHRHADACAARPAPQRANGQQRTMPTPGEIMTREEDRLKERLADIQAERPALETLYNVLSPEQRMQLTRGGRQDRMGPGRNRFADARGPRGRMAPPPDSPDAPPPPTR